MESNRPWRGWAMLLLFGFGLTQCRTPSDGSDAKFGWDEDLTPPAPSANTSPASTYTPKVDGSFCRGEKPGACFTLVVRIPTSDLVNDLGLSVLAMATKSKAMAKRLDEACQAAWVDYKLRYASSLVTPLRRTFIQKVNKMRCVFLPTSEEYLVESLPLASQETALSVRLTKFEVTGRNESATVSFLKLSSNATTVDTQFRAAATFAGKDVRGKEGPWRPLTAFQVTPVGVKQSFGKSLSWKVDVGATLSLLSKIDTSKIKDQTDQAMKAFLDRAKMLMGQASANGVSVGSSLVLIGAGYEVFKAICGEDASRCQVTGTSDNKLSSISEGVVPSSDASEALRTALIQSIESTLDKVFEGGDKAQLTEEYKLNS